MRDGALPVVFGYGSLIFRPDIDYVHAEWACLRGYARRFYQGSTDHRGLPGAPGRVVTLVEAPSAECWGVAYHVPSAEYDAMVERLDAREVGGYERRSLPLVTRNGARLENTLVYLAAPDNPAYLGPAPTQTMARQIAAASGPSGSNRDYLLKLAQALREEGVADPHVFALERQLLAL